MTTVVTPAPIAALRSARLREAGPGTGGITWYG